jgi:hypothetical protein
MEDGSGSCSSVLTRGTSVFFFEVGSLYVTQAGVGMKLIFLP